MSPVALRQARLGDGLHVPRPLQQQRGPYRRHRLAEQKALHLSAAFFLELLELLLGLDTFGSRLHAKAAAQAGDGSDNCNRFRTIKFVHERTVNLDRENWLVARIR
jgi:hypothetical protein